MDRHRGPVGPEQHEPDLADVDQPRVPELEVQAGCHERVDGSRYAERGANTVGLVIERKRREGELDGLLWFCENCNEKLYEEYFQLTDITTQFQGVFKKFYGSENLRTCNKCTAVMQPPK